MKQLFAFVFVVVFLAGSAAALSVSAKYDLDYDFSSFKHYEVSAVASSDMVLMDAPDLPDVSGYTVQAAIAQLPSVKPGKARVQPLEESYEYRKLKLQRLIPIYGEMQGRLDALAIEVLSGDFDLKTLTAAINDPKYMERKGAAYIAKVPILIGPEASLTIQDKLHLASDSGAFLSNFGKLYVVNAHLEGWNVAADQPSLFESDKKFRAHIVTWCGSEMILAGSTFKHLGYFASKAYGVSYTSCFEPVYEVYPDLERPKGWVIDSHFEDLYYGFYTYEADDIAVIRNIYKDSVIYGIDPHDRSNRLIIAYNEAYGTQQKHGIIVSREVNDSFIFNNISHDNHGSGFMVDRNSQHNVIAYNISKNNGGDGLTFYESPSNLSYANMLVKNGDSGLRIRNSYGITSRHDVINYNHKTGVQAYIANLTEGGKTRDLEMDPYEQRTSLDIAHPELVGNKQADFKLIDVERARFSGAKMLKSPKKVFAGDLRSLNLHLSPDFQTGVEVQPK